MGHDQIISGFCKTLINWSPIAYKIRAEKQRWLTYYHYSSPVPSGGIQAGDGGTLDDRDSEAQRV
jgi:hypothetical protein